MMDEVAAVMSFGFVITGCRPFGLSRPSCFDPRSLREASARLFDIVTWS